MPSLPQIRICAVSELESHLTWATHIVSIIHPKNRPKILLREVPKSHRLFLDFDDTTTEVAFEVPGFDTPTAPSVEDIAALIGFVEQLPASARLLFHCEMGVSRSTAAAFVALVVRDPETEPLLHLLHIQEIRPVAWPNELVIALADRSLNKGGALIQALKMFRNESD